VSKVIAKRLPHRAIPLTDALPILIQNDAAIAADFHAFYPELMAFVAQKKLR
jgi:acyl carrier protein phosphodiesterase